MDLIEEQKRLTIQPRQCEGSALSIYKLMADVTASVARLTVIATAAEDLPFNYANLDQTTVTFRHCWPLQREL